LIPYLSALENVELPMLLNGNLDRNRARELLEAVGLGHRIKHKPMEMSGGEQQRVGIAIALANNPQILLADEPTGSLDSKAGAQVLEVLRRVRDVYGVTVIVVTHDRGMAKAVDRYVLIRDGKISMESVRRPEAITTFVQDEEAQRKLEESHDEYVVLDSVGRMQLPEEYVKELGLRGRAKVKLVDGKVVIEPAEKKEA
jgi:ABC-type lipoprotein export system ATPase subunit